MFENLAVLDGSLVISDDSGMARARLHPGAGLGLPAAIEWLAVQER